MTYQSTTGNGDYGTLVQLGTENLVDSQLGGASPDTTSRVSTPTAPRPFRHRSMFMHRRWSRAVTPTGSKDYCVATEGVLKTRPALFLDINEGPCSAGAGGFAATGN